MFRCLRDDCNGGTYTFVTAISKAFPQEWGELKSIVKRPWVKRFDKAAFNKLVANFRRPVEGGSYKEYVKDHLLKDVQVDVDAPLEALLRDGEDAAGAADSDTEIRPADQGAPNP